MDSATAPEALPAGRTEWYAGPGIEVLGDGMRRHFVGFARYNQWANRRLYDALARMPAEALAEDRGAFFGSIIGTLNHLLVTDRIWLDRLTERASPPWRLDDILFPDLGDLRREREAEDERLIGFVDALTGERLGASVAYRNMAGEAFEQPLTDILGHVFNHQTHHRGQVHTLLTQSGHDAPSLDLIYFLRSPSH